MSIPTTLREIEALEYVCHGSDDVIEHFEEKRDIKSRLAEGANFRKTANVMAQVF